MKLKQAAAVKLSFAEYNSNDFIEIIGDILFRYNLKLCDTQTLKYFYLPPAYRDGSLSERTNLKLEQESGSSPQSSTISLH